MAPTAKWRDDAGQWISHATYFSRTQQSGSPTHAGEGLIGIAFFVSDLHGRTERYEKLFAAIAADRPDAVFLGGDLLPHHSMDHAASAATYTGANANTLPDANTRSNAHIGANVGAGSDSEAVSDAEAGAGRDAGSDVSSGSGESTSSEASGDFVRNYLARRLESLRASLGGSYPRVFLIFGNDDARANEAAAFEAQWQGVWDYVHGRRLAWGAFSVYGYACIPPSPFRLKDWERYDVSRFVDPGCVSPEEGSRSVKVPEREARNATIREDLARLFGDADLTQAVFLCHVPPYRSNLDRAGLDGMMVEHVPLDVHIGSIAVRQFVETRQPLLTLHGHVHESARITGSWQDRIGQTVCLSAAHDGPELALVRFDPGDPAGATRELI